MRRAGLTLLNDPTLIYVGGESVLLSHGDRYCTDDVEYMAVRKTMRDPAWQQQVLALPIEARRKMAGEARAESAAANAAKSMEIMDVNQQAIETALAEHGVTTMLHGHTHRPAVHDFELADGGAARRIVLGDWYEQGSVGVWSDAGFELRGLPRAS